MSAEAWPGTAWDSSGYSHAMSRADDVITGQGSALAALRLPAFRRLCAASYTDAIGTWMERLAVGWFVLDTTGSVFLAALSFAARSAPNMVLGPFGGVVADRFPRTRVLTVTTATKALLMVVLATLGYQGLRSAWPVLAVVAAGSVARVSEQATAQALLGDIIGRARVGPATSLYASGQRAVGLLASLGAGFLLARAGPGPVFLCAAVASMAASAQFALLRVPSLTAARGDSRSSFFADAADGLRIASRIPVVVRLLVLAVTVEVFAFSYQALLPALAERVLHLDATGLGILTFAASLGGVIGMLLLTRLVTVVPGGVLLTCVTGMFALGLLLLASVERLALSVALMVSVGATAAMFDGLQWVLLQRNVPDAVRGRVMGLWTMAIGFGWLGPVVLGALGEAFGTQPALALGGVIAMLAAGIAAATPALRRA